MFFVNNIMIVNRVGDLSEKEYPASLKRRWNLTSPIKGKPAIQKFNACQLLLCSLFLPIENGLQRPSVRNLPPPVGFSYCDPVGPSGDGNSCGSWNDTKTAKHSLIFMQNWMKAFPECLALKKL